MALKIEPNQSATAYHIVSGTTLFPYAVDAQMAISQHPLEWSDVPWTQERESEARARLDERNKFEGLPPLPAPVPLSPEDQAALDEHNKAVAEAAKRLADYHAKKAEEKKVADQVAADEALVASPPPRPDPNVRRPLSPAQIRKQAAETDEERGVRLKREADQQAAATRAGAPIT